MAFAVTLTGLFSLETQPMSRTLGATILPLAALVVTGATAFAAYDHLPYRVPLVAYRYPGAIVVLYAFFRLVAFADRRRTAQLDEVGLFRPLRDGAFLLAAHAHLIELGQGLGWISMASDLRIGALAWAVLLTGIYAPKQPDGLPGRLIQAHPFSLDPQARAQWCRGLVFSGALGVLGTFVGYAQIGWMVIPLGLVSIRAFRTRGGAGP